MVFASFISVPQCLSLPASILILEIFFSFLLLFGILDTRTSMPSIHASFDLSCIPINLKLLEYLSHNSRK